MKPNQCGAIEYDLRWYFTEATGECGVRSIQAGFEAQMNALARCGRGDGCMHLHETRSGSPDYDGPTDRQIEAIRRAKAIRERLSRLSPHDRRVLELQFGSDTCAGGVSLPLVCSMPDAIRKHQRATESARKADMDRRLDLDRRACLGQRQRSKATPKPKVKPPANSHLTGGSTVRDWIVLMSVMDKPLVARLVVAAKSELDHALAMYAATRVGA